jgi:hypothetical protein
MTCTFESLGERTRVTSTARTFRRGFAAAVVNAWRRAIEARGRILAWSLRRR